MKTHYSISELLEMNLEKFPKTNRAILYKVEREKWSFIEASCQGGKNGKRREYAPPPDVMKQIQTRKLEEALGGLEDLPSPTEMEGKPAVRNEETPLALPETVCIVDGSTEQQRLCESSRRGVSGMANGWIGNIWKKYCEPREIEGRLKWEKPVSDGLFLRFWPK